MMTGDPAIGHMLTISKWKKGRFPFPTREGKETAYVEIVQGTGAGRTQSPHLFFRLILGCGHQPWWAGWGRVECGWPSAPICSGQLESHWGTAVSGLQSEVWERLLSSPLGRQLTGEARSLRLDTTPRCKSEAFWESITINEKTCHALAGRSSIYPLTPRIYKHLSVQVSPKNYTPGLWLTSLLHISPNPSKNIHSSPQLCCLSPRAGVQQLP